MALFRCGADAAYTGSRQIGSTMTLAANTAITDLNIEIPDNGMYIVCGNTNPTEPSGYRPVIVIIDNYQIVYAGSPTDWSVNASTHKLSGPVLSGGSTFYIDLHKLI